MSSGCFSWYPLLVETKSEVSNEHLWSDRAILLDHWLRAGSVTIASSFSENELAIVSATREHQDMETNSKVAVTRWWLSLTLLLPRMKPAVTGSDDIDDDIVKARKGIERDIEDLLR